MEVFKAAILVLGAVALLASIAVAVSTRLGIIATLVACILAIGIGLTVDHFLLPVAQSSSPWASSASWAYSLIPNFQIFWMIDALSEDRLIPWSYIGRATLYCIAFIAAFLALGAAMFETREVG
jgi:ABC-type transport system involved in multi-copper enzyme maturation permease subunit